MQAEAIKKNGVERQCNIHKPLANAPMVSDLEFKGSKIIFFIETFIKLIIILNLPNFVDGY